MDSPSEPSTMIDQELIDEWYRLIADAEDRQDRATALPNEIDKRGIDR